MDSSFMKCHKRSPEALHGWLIVVKTWQAMSRYLLSPLLAQGMGELDFRVLEIPLHKGSMPVNAIGPKVYLNSGSVGVAVDRLYKKGFVDRLECKEDRRVRTVSLTEKRTSSIYSCVSPACRTALLSMLGKTQELSKP